MIWLLRLVLISILVTALMGCGATGARFQNLPSVKSKQGVLVVYRPYDGAIKTDFTLLIDNRSVGDLKKNGYRYFLLSPGKHWLEVNGPDTVDFYVTITSGQYCFIRLSDRDVGNFLSSTIAGPYVSFPIVSRLKYISIQQANRKTALAELKHLRYSKKTKKKSNNHDNY